LLVVMASVGCGADVFTEPPPATRSATVTVVLSGKGSGSVKSGDGKIDCSTATPAGCKTTVTFTEGGSFPLQLTATADASARFAGWAAPCGAQATCSVAVTGDVTLVASFDERFGLTVDFQRDADATSNLATVPTGIDLKATGKATAYFDPGTSVVLTVDQGASPETFRFTGACTGTNGRTDGTSCKLTMDGPKTVGVRVAHYNYAFVTWSKSTGAMGGRIGADGICNTLATNAGLPGSYVAFLSTETEDAIGRLSQANGWRRTDGAPFIFDRGTSFGPSGTIRAALDRDETGKVPAGFDESIERIHTGSNPDGSRLNYGGSDHCGNWTTTNASVSQGGAVISGRPWLAAGAGPCSASLRFVCMGTDLNRTLPAPVAPSGARRAFLSSGQVLPSQGLSTFDQLCKTEAAGAALPNPNNYKALVAPNNSTSAASRFDTSKGPWMGTDLVLLAPTAQALLQSYPWIAGIHRFANGAASLPGADVVVTGYRNTTTLPTAKPSDSGNYTCGGWALTTGLAGFGQAGFTGSFAMSYFENAPSVTCASPARVYCLED
jgi:hypothetical protein